jgi:hypothetical protein
MQRYIRVCPSDVYSKVIPLFVATYPTLLALDPKPVKVSMK